MGTLNSFVCTIQCSWRNTIWCTTKGEYVQRASGERCVFSCSKGGHQQEFLRSLRKEARASRSIKEGEQKHMAQQCSHLDQIRDVTPSANGCEDCLKTGDTWVHLRLCLTCGHVGCCDDSKNRHATRHFHATNHPIIQSFEPGEEWAWCYIDELLLEPA